MNYVSQTMTPIELIKAVGFEEAPDSGYQIVITPNTRKPNPYDYRTMIPFERLHAKYFENQLNIHYDMKLGKRKHKSSQMRNPIPAIMHKIKLLDWPDSPKANLT